jgi:ABC-2 type transport system permease protein
MPGLIAGEFRKLFTTWLWLWTLLAATAITALYAILDIAFADAPDTFTLPLSTPQGQRTLLAVGAAGAPLVAVLGAIGLTGEFRHRTVTATFLATPHRGRVVVAKLITYALVGAGYGLAGLAVTITIALPWLASNDIDLVVGGGAIAATLAGVTAAVAIFAMLGVGLGRCCVSKSRPWPGCCCTCTSWNASSPASPASAGGRATCPARPRKPSSAPP